VLLASTSVATLLGGHAFAQTSPSNQVSEVVVTATRRGDASVLTTPLAVTAVSGQTLAREGIYALRDLQKVDPSLDIQSYGAAQTKIVIRGIESNVGSTSGMYLDETPLVGGMSSNILGDGKPGLRLYDINRVEVLKGPQGTLFGSSSMSGTLRVITNKPNLEDYSGNVSVSDAAVDGGNDFFNGNATINAPIIKDVVGVRVTAWGENGGGFIDQTINGDLHKNDNDSHTKGGRVIALWQATPDFSITATGVHQEIDVDGTQAWQLSQGPYKNISPTSEFYKDNYNLFALTGEYKLGFGTVTATSSYTDQRVVNPKDSTPTAHSFGLTGSTLFVPTSKFRDLTSELRFSSSFKGPFQLVAGAYYDNSQTLYQTNSVVATAAGNALCYTYSGCTQAGLRNPGRGDSDYEFGTNTFHNVGQYALYAQGDYKLLDNLTATVGIRYFAASIHDTVENLQTVYPDFIFGRITTPSITGNTHGSNTSPSYNFSLLWRAESNISLYVRAASGFRIGGVNTATSLAQEAGVVFPGTYRPDKLWDYEGGVKSFWLSHTLTIDADVYHIDWNSQQLSALAPGAFAYTINAGKSETNGFEVNATYKPERVPGLSVTAAYTYVNAKLDQDLPAAVIAAGTYGYKGDAVPLTPNNTFSIQGEYDHPVMDGVEGYLQAGANYHGGSHTSFNDKNTYDTKLPAYYLVDAKIGVRKDSWDVSLFANNLTNKAAYLGVVESVDGVRIFSPPPRTVGVRVSKAF
jgi:outer membrane receptor protein involved in Fe transport